MRRRTSTRPAGSPGIRRSITRLARLVEILRDGAGTGYDQPVSGDENRGIALPDRAPEKLSRRSQGRSSTKSSATPSSAQTRRMKREWGAERIMMEDGHGD